MGDRNTVQYTPLLQDVSSDDEDDIYPSEFHAGTTRNGTPGDGSHDVMVLKRLESAPTRRNHGRQRTPLQKKSNKKVLALVLVGCVLVIVGVAAAVLAYFRSEFGGGVVQDVYTGRMDVLLHGGWTTFYNDTESSVTLIDVDGDGLDDVLIGTTQLELFMGARKLLPNHTMKEACTKLGFEYPCQGQLVAVRGYDGKTLWQTWLRSGLIFINCHDIDVNQDNKPDCIVTGRESSLQAVELKTGKPLWVTDAEEEPWSSHFVRTWNVYRAAGLQDVDGDGVRDVLVTHGGDPEKDPEDHDRAAGRIIVLSGATGRPLGQFVAMPDSKETYMSPVMYKTANGTNYFLFGSGGETIPGDLMIISESDLTQFVMRTDTSQPSSHAESHNNSSSEADINQSPLRFLFRGQAKGVMVAPVFVDMTGDGTPDILVSAFEGLMILLDGESLQEIWRQQFPGMESYSTPAPAQFDDDGIVDFMVSWGKGEWPVYQGAKVYIISGKDGSILWETYTHTIQMSSDLSLKTTHHQDMFLYRLIGRRASTSSRSVVNEAHGAASGRRKKRHLGGHADDDGDDDHIPLDTSPEEARKLCESILQDYKKRHLTCSDDLSGGITEVFLMDSRHAQRPTLIHRLMPEKLHYNYSLDAQEGMAHCHQPTPGHKNQVSLCVPRLPRSTTGAVGDVNGDGKPDVILLDVLIANTITDRYSHLETHFNLVLTRIILRDAVEFGEATALNLSYVDKGLSGGYDGQSLKDVEFLPDEDQPWRQYMGSGGDGVYRTGKRGDPSMH